LLFSVVIFFFIYYFLLEMANFLLQFCEVFDSH